MCRHLLLACFLSTVPLGAHGQRAAYEELQTFSTVMNLIRLNHVDSVSYTPLVRAAIEGALHAVDPHSRYVRRDIEARLIAARSGELGTAGLELDASAGAVTVVAVGVGSPAERAGMLPGDRVALIQDTSTIGLSAHEVEALLSGAPRSERRVVVERGDPLNAERAELTIRLDRYTWPNVSAPLLLGNEVGYVRLGGFDVRAAAELDRALNALQRAGMTRLVLDLRGNPGGLLSEAVSIAGLFLPKDALVMEVRGRKRDANQSYRTRAPGGYQRMPLVLLVDGSSASAAEALAGALQDHRRALIVGHRTYGKALVQMPFPLPAGDVLWLTIARVHTPDGRMIQRPYDGIPAARYLAATDALRRGGPEAGASGTGGIVPDTYLPARPATPPGWQELRRSGGDLLTVQRAVLSGSDPGGWTAPLLESLRTALAGSTGRTPDLSAEQQEAAVRHLAMLAIRLRSGEGAAAEYAVRSDPEVRRAAALLDELRPAR